MLNCGRVSSILQHTVDPALALQAKKLLKTRRVYPASRVSHELHLVLPTVILADLVSDPFSESFAHNGTRALVIVMVLGVPHMGVLVGANGQHAVGWYII